MLLRRAIASLLSLMLCCTVAHAAQEGDEPVEATICRLIETSARAHNLPVTFLTRLIWRESSFRSTATSPAGAQGIAQFMPGTAVERGLANPFDPEEAIPKAAALLADLKARFGNLGLAAAAYNAGPARVEKWVATNGFLPAETRAYVAFITRHAVEDWTGEAAAETAKDTAAVAPMSCTATVLASRRDRPFKLEASSFWAPWGVQLAGNFSKSLALVAYGRARSSYSAVLGALSPMIIGGRMAGRGARTYYRVRAPAQTREAAQTLCEKIHRVGGACIVLRS